MTPFAVGTIAAAITAALGLVALALSQRSERRGPRTPPLDQGARGEHRSWFEARWVRRLHPDVLYAVIVSGDRVLLANTGASLSGPATAPSRRERFAAELASATSPDALVTRRPHGLAFPLAEVRRATFRTPPWWYGRTGPGLLVLERGGQPPLELMIDDESQLSACAAVLAPALGAAFEVPPALAPAIRDPVAAREALVLRAKARTALGFALTSAVFSAFVAWTEWGARHQPRTVTGRVVGCSEHRAAGRSGPSIALDLDVPPGRIECLLRPFDVSSELREVCAKKATIHAMYRSAPSGRLWVVTIGVEGGSEILPAWVGEERDEAGERTAAGVLGACGTIAAGGAGALVRLRRRLRAVGA